MVKVAICDDEISIGSELEYELIDIFTQHNIDFEIDIFFTSKELNNKMESGYFYDLIFLDIEFPQDEINGIETGAMIRNVLKQHSTSIVYISWEQKYSMQLFESRPINFLIKPLDKEKIRQTLETYLLISDFGLKEFTYKKGHDTFKEQLKDIVFFECNKRKINIYFSGGRKDSFYGSLKEIYNGQLKELDFLYAHASYVVNYDYITVVKYNEIFLSELNTSIPISPNKRKETRQKYFSIMKKRRIQ